MSTKFLKEVEGNFEIKRFDRGRMSTKVVLELKGEQYYIYLRYLEDIIIGKTHVYLTLGFTEARNWIVKKPNDMINIKVCNICNKEIPFDSWSCCNRHNFKTISRKKRTITDKFTVVGQYRTGGTNSTQRIRLECKSFDEVFSVFLYELLNDNDDSESKLAELMAGEEITLKERKVAGTYIWQVQ
jgi:hypothetical protein